jgi:hypothetical protein
MSTHRQQEDFFQRHLDPARSLGEILFGLIMVLTAALPAGLTVAKGKTGGRQILLFAAGVQFCALSASCFPTPRPLFCRQINPSDLDNICPYD